MSRRYALRITLLGLHLLVITAACLAPAFLFSNVESGGLPIDKLVHFLLFSSFGLSLHAVVPLQISGKYISSLAAAFTYAVLVESAQTWFPHLDRSFEYADLLANGFGIACSVILAILKKKSRINPKIRFNWPIKHHRIFRNARQVIWSQQITWLA